MQLVQRSPHIPPRRGQILEQPSQLLALFEQDRCLIQQPVELVSRELPAGADAASKALSWVNRFRNHYRGREAAVWRGLEITLPAIC